MNLTNDLKDEIGQTILDRIKKRTLSGKDKAGAPFAKYSKAYKESLEFKSFNKGTKPNLKLTGDMLGLMDFQVKGNTIVVGWDDSDDDEAAKAHGHITGADGRLPVRDFFGLSEKEISSIKSKFKGDIDG